MLNMLPWKSALCMVLGAGLGLAGGSVSAQAFPAKPVRLLIGYAPGGSADLIGRALSQKAPEHLGRPLIIENVPGAGSRLAIQRAATSAPDGYTILLLSEGGLMHTARGAKLPYDLVRDLTAVSFVALGTNGLVVHPSMPVHSVKQLIALAQKHPGKLSYGSSGTGSAQHLTGELFSSMANVKLVHVPYKGGGPNAAAVAGGEIEMTFSTIPAILPFMNAGRLRLLAVTVANRVSFLPNVPTLHESGLTGFDYPSWYGIKAPAGVPPEIIARLSTVIGTIVNLPDTKAFLNKSGLDPHTNTPQQFNEFIRNQIVKSGKLAKMGGVSSE